MNNQPISKPSLELLVSWLKGIVQRILKSRQNTILILDWLILIAVAVLVMVIYIPKGIWAEEDGYRRESRRRMQIIQNAEEFFHTLRGNYSTDGTILFKLISQAHDSLIADSTFIGNQIVRVDGRPYRVNIPEFFSAQMDTTFTVGRSLRREILDTTFTLTLWNDEREDYDTLFVNGSSGLSRLMTEPAFSTVLDTSYGSHSEVYTDYRWNRYRLESELLICPVTEEPYFIGIDSAESALKIASPIEGEFAKRRYIIFKFVAEDHGEIVAGEPSWRRL